MARHLITGAGSGIGALLATRLLRRGDSLVLLARSPERANSIRKYMPGAQVLVADLADAYALEAIADSLPETLDSVVHVAGVIELGRVDALSIDDWRSQLAVNLLAPAVLSRVCLPALRAARGTVIFTNSTGGLIANPLCAAYAASKFGLRALADSLRAEEQANGVRVSSIFPYRTATPMQEKVHQQEGQTYNPTLWIDPATLVDLIVHVLDLPSDATVTDLTVRSNSATS